MVGVDVIDCDEFAIAELQVTPLPVLAVVLLESIKEVPSEDQNGVIELDSLLQQALILHTRVPDVCLLGKVYADN